MTVLIEITPTPEQLLPELKFEDQQITCSSLDVANHFEKQHRDVLKAIRNLECSEDYRLRNFAQTVVTRENPSGGAPIESPAFKITRDGFTFLAMGFTGKKAAAWKEAYINAFNQMEKRLQHIFDPMVIEFRKEQIGQIERQVTRLEKTLHPEDWEITESLKVMVLQFSRELLLTCQDKVLLEDRTKALQEVGLLPSSAESVDHPTIILFWDQIKKIGLALVNRSVEDGLMCISPRWYFQWCKNLGMKPVASERELDDTFRLSIDFPYLGKQFRKGKKPEFCWYFAHSLASRLIAEQKMLSADQLKAKHKHQTIDDIAELINGEDA